MGSPVHGVELGTRVEWVEAIFADRAYVMELGEFILNGPAKAIAANARVAASYLGFAREGVSEI